jgi:hypothetical protein
MPVPYLNYTTTTSWQIISIHWLPNK